MHAVTVRSASLHDRQGAADHALGTRMLFEVVQKRLDKNLHAMRQRRETVEHPFGTLKMRMGPRTS
jgi:hypothetical protein